jgi:hypothetical protein
MRIERSLYCLILISLLFILPGKTKGQEQDFGAWYSVNIDHSISKKMDMTLKASFRTYKNAAVLDEAFIEGELSYNINDYISAAASYRLSEVSDGKEGNHVRHKLFAIIKGKVPLDRFTFYARAIFQATIRTYVEDEIDKRVFYTGRLKLKAAYNIKSFPVDPYIGFESFTKLTVSPEYIIDKARISAGFDYRINNKHSAQLEYILERDAIPELYYIHIVSATYSFAF